MIDKASDEDLDELHYATRNLITAGVRGFIPCIRKILKNVSELPEIHNNHYILHKVAGAGQHEALKLLLDQDWILKRIEQRNEYDDTPLGHAAHYRNVGIMEILMDYGASTDIEPSNDSAMTYYEYNRKLAGGRLLTFAAIKNDMEMLDLLLRRGLKPEWEETYNLGDTHLCIALRSNNLEMAQKFLDHGANVKFSSNRKIYPLISAIASCGLEMVKRLVDLGADYTTHSVGGDTLAAAAKYNRKDVFDFLLERGAILKSGHLDYTLGRSLSIAAQILDQGRDENAGDLFMSACKSGLINFVRVFLDHGVDPNSEITIDSGESNALEIAVNASDTAMVNLLLDAGADASGGLGGKLLSSAVHGGNMEILKALLDGGADANEWISIYERPLLKAVRTRRNSAARLLLEHGADFNHSGGAYGTPLSTANNVGDNSEMSELLISWGGLETQDLDL